MIEMPSARSFFVNLRMLAVDKKHYHFVIKHSRGSVKFLTIVGVDANTRLSMC